MIFFVRVLVNPKYAPSMILGRLIIRHQVPDYVGAPQKHFAWTIGLGLGIAMLWLLVLNDIRGPLNLVICFSCLMLLFFETAFGICLGCYLYHVITKKAPQLCPGNTCQFSAQEPIQRVSLTQWLVLSGFIISLVFLALDYNRMKSGEDSWIGISKSKPKKQAVQELTSKEITTIPPECIPPDSVVAIGHADRWREHHGCNKPETDNRQSLQLTEAEKTIFLSDMRKMLKSIQTITLALAVEDRRAMSEAATVSGNQMARNTPVSIKQKLPPSFQSIGAPMHLAFEEFAIRAETDSMPGLNELLGQMMNNCIACHSTFKVN